MYRPILPHHNPVRQSRYVRSVYSVVAEDDEHGVVHQVTLVFDNSEKIENVKSAVLVAKVENLEVTL